MPWAEGGEWHRQTLPFPVAVLATRKLPNVAHFVARKADLSAAPCKSSSAPEKNALKRAQVDFNHFNGPVKRQANVLTLQTSSRTPGSNTTKYANTKEIEFGVLKGEV